VRRATADILQRESHLRDSEAKFRSYIDNSPEGIFVLDENGRYLEVNRAAIDMTGYAEAELLAMCVTDLLPPDSAAIALQYFQTMKEQGHVSGELEFLHKNGERRWRSVDAVKLSATRFLGFTKDISGRKNAEEKLRLQSMVLDQIQDTVTVTDTRGIITYVNQAQATVFRCSREDLVGKSVVSYGHDPSRGATQQEIIEETLAGGQWRGEIINIDANGLPIVIDCRTTLVRDETGRVVGMCGIGTEITERKQADELLKKSEESFRGVFETSPTGIAIVDFESQRFVRANKSFLGIVGYSEEELLTKSVHDITHPDDRALEQQKLLERLDEPSKVFFLEKRYLRKDGTVRWVQVTGDVIRTDSGTQSALANVIDVTESKRAKTALQASLAEKEVLLREVHHRVKNNLASIVGLIELQRSSLEEPKAVKMLVELGERVRSMSLIHEKLYKSESLSKINCQEYLDELIFQLRCSYESSEVSFDVTADGVEMPLDSAVPCALIVNELVTNALKYAFPDKMPRTGTGGCRIRVLLARENETYTLSVADNGVGLPEGVDLISAKTLGLVLVRMLGQHQLGGTYHLDQDQGTRFTLTFSHEDSPCAGANGLPQATETIT
jgi:PAS domain S-box-containing protein